MLVRRSTLTVMCARVSHLESRFHRNCLLWTPAASLFPSKEQGQRDVFASQQTDPTQAQWESANIDHTLILLDLGVYWFLPVISAPQRSNKLSFDWLRHHCLFATFYASWAILYTQGKEERSWYSKPRLIVINKYIPSCDNLSSDSRLLTDNSNIFSLSMI